MCVYITIAPPCTGLRAPAAELRLQVLLCSLQQRSVSPEMLRELQLVAIVQQLEQHTHQGVQQAAQQLLTGVWRGCARRC